MDGKIRILLVEDETSLSDVIALNLELEGFSVHQVTDGKDAFYMSMNESWNLIILDIMLPGLNGLEICKNLRSANIEVPILFISARGESADRILGLKTGGDDYLSKPFDLEELLLRVNNLVKRKSNTMPALNSFIDFGNGCFNPVTFLAKEKTGEINTLSKKEIQLLLLFTKHANEVLSRERIIDELWGENEYPSTRTIDNYILHFRKLFENKPSNPKCIISIRGVGYKYVSGLEKVNSPS